MTLDDLSESAFQLLVGDSPIKEAPPDVVFRCLREAGVEPTPPLVEFFVTFGGYSYTPRGGDRVSLLTATQALEQGCSVERRLPFCRIRAARVAFTIDEHGVLYTDDLPVAENIVTWIERDAMRNEVGGWSDVHRIILPDKPRDSITLWIDRHMRRASAACDEFAIWWSSPTAVARRFTPYATDLGYPTPVWVFCATAKAATELVDQFERDFGLRPVPEIAWPRRG